MVRKTNEWDRQMLKHLLAATFRLSPLAISHPCVFLCIAKEALTCVTHGWPSSTQASAISEDEEEEEESTILNPFAFGSGDLLGSGDEAILGEGDAVEAELGSGNFTLGEDEEEEDDEDVSWVKWNMSP